MRQIAPSKPWRVGQDLASLFFIRETLGPGGSSQPFLVTVVVSQVKEMKHSALIDLLNGWSLCDQIVFADEHCVPGLKVDYSIFFLSNHSKQVV